MEGGLDLALALFFHRVFHRGDGVMTMIQAFDNRQPCWIALSVENPYCSKRVLHPVADPATVGGL